MRSNLCKRSCQHPVDIEHAVEMIDFMLQDPGRPPVCQPRLWLAVSVEAGYFDLAMPFNERRISGDAQAALQEQPGLLALWAQDRVDEHPEPKGPAFSLVALLRREIGGGLLGIL